MGGKDAVRDRKRRGNLKGPVRPKHILPPLIALAILGYGGWTLLNRGERTPPDTIVANGTIEATETDVSPKVAGHILRLMVGEGDEVEAGEEIATLDGEELTAQVEQARGAYEAARARLADLLRGSREEQIRQARAALKQAEAAADGARRALSIAKEAYAKSTELKAQLVNAQTAYEAAEKVDDQARAKLNLLEAGTRPEQIEQAEANVEQAKAQATNARENAARAENLFAAGALSRQQRDAAVAQRDALEATLAAAQARLTEVRAGPRAEELEQARAGEAQAKAQLEGAERYLEAVKEMAADRLALEGQVEAARTQYETASQQVAAARAQLDLLVAGPTKEAIEAARGQEEQARGALAAAEATTEYLIVKAPASGTIILKNTEVGEMATPGMPIVRIASLDSVWVRVYVPLPELRVRVGDRADVVTDAYPEKRYPGVVTEVAEKPEFTPKNVQTKEERVKLVFGVKVQLENPSHELKPGMPADATIYVQSRPGRER